jgi:hypothetical protein
MICPTAVARTHAALLHSLAQIGEGRLLEHDRSLGGADEGCRGPNAGCSKFSYSAAAPLLRMYPPILYPAQGHF